MQPLTRSALLGASSAIALVGLPLMSTFVEAAVTASPDDLATLNTAIELERAAIKAYDDAAATKLLSPHVLEAALKFRGDHVAHRDALIAAVKAGGGTPTEKTFALTYPPLQSEGDIVRFARTLEMKAASTYLSVVPELKDRKLASAAAAILGVETTHVALLSAALNEPAYPGHFVG